MKSGKKMSPMEAKAKLSTLKSLMKEMDGMMLDGMKNAKGMKVSVMSDSPEGLKEGLEKAEDIVEGDGEMSSNLPKMGKLMESEDEDESEDEEMMSDSEEEDSDEDLDAKIAELLAKKKSKESKRMI